MTVSIIPGIPLSLEFEHKFMNSQISGGSIGELYMIYRCDIFSGKSCFFSPLKQLGKEIISLFRNKWRET